MNMVMVCAYLKRYALVGVAVLVMSGCAGMPQPGSRLDADNLRNAIVADDVSYVRATIEARVAKVDELIPAPVYIEGTPLITVAARAGSVEVVRYLVAAGANVNALTPAYETALMLAIYFPSEEGAPNDGRHAKVAHLLVDAGSSLENLEHCYTPLAYAAYQGRDDLIRYLIKQGARVNADASNGMIKVNTPLMMAAIQGKRSSALLLLRAGADARVRLKDGHTAAELAAKYQGGALVSLLKCAESAGPGETFIRKCDGR